MRKLLKLINSVNLHVEDQDIKIQCVSIHQQREIKKINEENISIYIIIQKNKISRKNFNQRNRRLVH